MWNLNSLYLNIENIGWRNFILIVKYQHVRDLLITSFVELPEAIVSDDHQFSQLYVLQLLLSIINKHEINTKTSNIS